MTTNAIILADGSGSFSAGPFKSNLGNQIGGKSLVEWHVALLMPTEVREVRVVAPHLGDEFQTLIADVPHIGMDLTVIHDQNLKGTVADLQILQKQTKADEFLVLLGDVLMSLPVQQFLSDWRASRAGVAVVVHPISQMHESGATFPTHSGSVLVVPEGKPSGGVPNMSSAGLFAITREAILRYRDCREIGSDLLYMAAQEGNLFAFVSSHYLKDTGTPARLEETLLDVSSGAWSRRGKLTPRPALFLDRDGVINPSQPEFYCAEEYVLLPGVGRAISEANVLGLPVIVVTNQPHIANGRMTFEDHQEVRARMDQLLSEQGAFVDDYIFCPHHPESGSEGEIKSLKFSCNCRKPSVGMALEAQQRHTLDLGRSVLVGDTDRDRGLAAGTGMQFIHVSASCTYDDPLTCFQKSPDAIRRGIEILTR